VWLEMAHDHNHRSESGNSAGGQVVFWKAHLKRVKLFNCVLVTNRSGGAVSWEETSARLGVVEERVGLAEMEVGAHDMVGVGSPRA